MGINGWEGPEGKGLHQFFELVQNKPTAGLCWAPSRRAIVLRISIFPITPRVIETFEVGCRKRPYLRDAEGGGPRRTQGDIEVGLHTSCSCLFATSLFFVERWKVNGFYFPVDSFYCTPWKERGSEAIYMIVQSVRNTLYICTHAKQRMNKVDRSQLVSLAGKYHILFTTVCEHTPANML